MTPLNLLSHERVSDRLVRITEGYSMVHRFSIGLVVGDEAALVIDAGLGGHRGLRRYVEGLVGPDKPLICVCTHGHPDHVGSAIQFDRRHLSHRDLPLLETFALKTEVRLTDLEAFALWNDETVDFCRRDHLDNTATSFEDVDEGHVFDLGGTTVEVHAIPGHTAGSLAYYSRDGGFVYTGDAVNADIRLTKLDRAGMAQYAETLDRFVSTMENAGVDTVFAAHLPLKMGLEIPRSLAVACREIVAGDTAEDPPAETIFRDRTNNPRLRMHYVDNSCVVYDRQLVAG